MSADPQTAVVVDVADAPLAERIERLLAAASIASLASAGPPGGRPDLVVSTRPAALAALGWAPPGPADSGLAADVGLIVIGCQDPVADAELGPDFSDRELVLACRLLGQAVHWRRKALHTAATGRELQRLAHTDALTHVANRRAWDIELPRRLAEAQSAGQAVAMAVFDVDHFKPVNDGLGHTAGDTVLAAIGRGLADSLRSGDFVARLGGDEFGLLLVGSFDEPAALRIVERVRKYAMSGLASFVPGPISITAGCTAAAPGVHTPVADLFAAADQALRDAKQAGRNRTFFRPLG